MRIFVTGGAGYIGSHTALQLLRDGHDVLVYDNFRNSSPSVLARVTELAGRSATCVEGDICDRKTLDAAMSDFAPDAVIHFAGRKAVGELNEIPLEYYRTNVAGTVELLESMKAHGCARIVFSSSATVYGNAQYLPFDEKHPIGATNPYGRTKAFAEDIIRDWAHSWPEASAILLRYFNPVGADPSGLIGEDPSGIPNNLVPYIAQVAVGRLERLAVFGNDYETRDGTGERDFIHVCDLADAHLAALNYATRAKGCEAINVGTGKGTTVLEMIAAFEQASGRKIAHAISPRRPGDVATSIAAVDHCRALLGWEAKRSVDDMCASTWKWQSTGGKGAA